jgi:HAD superfamily phosphatase (TIGR01668 family)
MVRKRRSIFKLIHPYFRVHSVTHATPTFFKEYGIKAVILDLDGNLIGYREEQVHPEVLSWIKQLSDAGLKVCILTNPSRRSTLKIVAPIMGLQAFSGAYPKPFPWGFYKARAHLEVPFSEIAVVGDQLFTDVLGGNAVGAFTIWSDRREGAKEGWFTRKFNRRLENIYKRVFPKSAPYLKELS